MRSQQRLVASWWFVGTAAASPARQRSRRPPLRQVLGLASPSTGMAAPCPSEAHLCHVGHLAPGPVPRVAESVVERLPPPICRCEHPLATFTVAVAMVRVRVTLNSYTVQGLTEFVHTQHTAQSYAWPGGREARYRDRLDGRAHAAGRLCSSAASRLVLRSTWGPTQRSSLGTRLQMTQAAVCRHWHSVTQMKRAI